MIPMTYQITKVADGDMRFTSRKVEEPLIHVEPIQVANLRRFTDYVKGLTAVKNEGLRACFVTELDPQWDPEEEDLLYLMKQINPMDSADVENIEAMAGEVISKMCSEMEIYWFANLSPPTLPPAVRNSENNRVTEKEPPILYPSGEELIEPPKRFPASYKDEQHLENTEAGNGYMKVPPTIVPQVDTPVPPIMNNLLTENMEPEKNPKRPPLQTSNILPDFPDMNEFYKNHRLSHNKLFGQKEPMSKAAAPQEQNLEVRTKDKTFHDNSEEHNEKKPIVGGSRDPSYIPYE